MTAYVAMYHFESKRPRRLADFWSQVLCIPVDEGATDDLAMIDVEHHHGPVTWIFQRAQDETGSPGGAGRVSLSLTDDEDWRGEVSRIVGLVAAARGDHEVDGVRWSELADPDGNTFRVFAPRPA